MKERQLKVYVSQDKPEIRLKGEWLRENGFSAGTRISILYDRGFMIIVPGEEIKGAREALEELKNRP